MWQSIKNFFSGMFSTTVEIDKPFEYPKYDSKKLKKELDDWIDSLPKKPTGDVFSSLRNK